MNSNDRTSFEKAFKTRHSDLKLWTVLLEFDKELGKYLIGYTQESWMSWQSAKEDNSKWIKCSDRLPVLADASDTFEVFIFNGTWVSRHAYDFVKYVPAFTHWMPIPKLKLPDPPEGFFDDQH